MAESMKLTLTFACDNRETGLSEEHNFSWKYAKEMPLEEDVKALGAAMIANGSIFEYVPKVLRAAKVVVTTENEIDVNE